MNDNIISTLCTLDANEKRLAYKVLWLQAVMTLTAAGIIYSVNLSPNYWLAVLCGGFISALNGALLAWRMTHAAINSANENEAHYQLRNMYLYAAERFLVVSVLLALCLGSLALPSFLLLGGFVGGQVVFLVARLFLNK